MFRKFIIALLALLPLAVNAAAINGVKITNGAPYQQGVFVGVNAGASAPSTINYGSVGIGAGSLQSLTAGGAESACGGAFSCQYLTNGYAATAWGEHTIGFDNANYLTAVGNDSMRNTVGVTNSTAVGAESFRDGIGPTNSAFGAFSLHGNSGSILVGGSKTTGDVLCIPLSTTNPNVTNLPAQACYTVQSGDTLPTIITGLSTAINALGVVYNLPSGRNTFTDSGVGLNAFGPAPYGGAANVIGLHFPGGDTTGWAISIGTPTCTGTCTETLTPQLPFAGSFNTALGLQALYSIGLGDADHNTAVGYQALTNLQGTASGNTATGSLAGFAMLTGINNSLYGIQSGTGITTGTYNSCFGYQTCSGITTGVGNTTLGAVNGTGSTVITGNGNVVVGYGSTVPSTSGNYQMSLQNIIYGINNNIGGGGSGTAGKIGIGNSAPTARFDIKGVDALAATSVFRIQNSTPTDLLTVFDDGHITSSIGLGASATGVSAAAITSTGTKFTISGCSAGTTVGGASAGTFVSGTTGACTVVITMRGADGITTPNGWSCFANNRTTANFFGQTASSATTATFSGVTVTNDVINFGCTGI